MPSSPHAPEVPLGTAWCTSELYCPFFGRENLQRLGAFVHRVQDGAAGVGIDVGNVQTAVADEFGNLPHAVEPAARLLRSDVVADIGSLFIACGDDVCGHLRREGVVAADDLDAERATPQGVRDDGADFGRRRIVVRDRAAGPEDQQAADVDAGAEALHAVKQGFRRCCRSRCPW